MNIDFQLIATTLAKGTLLLVVALGVAAALRRSPAGARHLVWLTTLATLLLFPALTRWEPMRLEVLPPLRESAVAAFGVDNPLRNTTRTPAAAATRAQDASPSRATDSDVRSFDRPSPASIAIGIWLAGAAALLGWLGIGIFAVRRIVNGGRVLDDTRWTTPLYEVADRMNLDVVPRLIISERVEMPFACGIWRPTIVFPASADNWNDDRRRVVLFHELAHIKRRDLIGHALGRFACALYWFHPLVWSAARHLRAESERACDDLVLACGARASDYVAHLLDIITSVKHGGAPVTALPMARKKEFEGRMLAILDPAIPRGAPGRLQSVGIFATLVLITLSVAAAAPARAPMVVAAEPAAPDATADLLPDSRRPDVLDHQQQAVPLSQSEKHEKHGELPKTFSQQTEEQTEELVEKTTEKLTRNSVDKSVTSSREPVDAIAQAQQSADKVEALIRILGTDDDGDVRRSAAWGLAQMRDKRVVAALAEAFRKDRDEDVREMAIWALAHLTDDPDIFADALKQDTSEDVRETAAWALGNRDGHEGDAALISALKDDSPEVRRTATWALGNTRARRSSSAIVALLKDEDAEVRLMSAWALGQILDPATAPALRAAFVAETDDEARQAQFRALAFMGEASPEFIEIAMKSKDPELRSRAVRVLAGQGTGAWPWPWPWPRPRPMP